MKQVTTLAYTFLAALTLACSPGGVTTGGGGGPGGGGNPLVPDAGLPTSGRISNGLVALYRFDEGIGDTVYDVSGELPALDLTISTPGSVTWSADGLTLNQAAQISSGNADRITTACQASNAMTVEVWARSQDLNQTGPARLVDFSLNANATNFSLAQNTNETEAALRTSATIEDEDEVALAATLADNFATTDTHLLYTRTGITDDYELWLNGQRNELGQLAGSFANWNPGSILSIGNEPNGNRPWRGTVYLAAVYCRALSAEEIIRNYDEGF